MCVCMSVYLFVYLPISLSLSLFLSLSLSLFFVLRTGFEPSTFGSESYALPIEPPRHPIITIIVSTYLSCRPTNEVRIPSGALETFVRGCFFSSQKCCADSLTVCPTPRGDGLAQLVERRARDPKERGFESREVHKENV